MRALVVDDSGAMRRILTGIMEEAGFEVTAASDGREGLERLGSLGTVDIALVDWHMPVMNGIEFVRAVREEPAHSEMRIMMVTTEAETSSVITALEAGANEFIMKPFQKEGLMEKLQILGVIEG